MSTQSNAFVQDVLSSQCLFRRCKPPRTQLHFFFLCLLTNLVSLYTQSAVYCLISPDISRAAPLPALAALDFTVTHCTKEAQARKMPLCENAT